MREASGVESFFLDRPLNFAHRGAEHEAPENTLAAFERAAELGADGIEFDVHLSKDGEVVVIHGFSVESTTDGSGLVKQMTLAELKELDAGGWFGPALVGQRIPTLQEVLDAVGDCLLLNIELKTKSLRDDGLPAAVVRRIETSEMCKRVTVSSFNPLAVRRVKQLNSLVQTGFLYASHAPLFPRRRWLRSWVRPDAVHPHHTMVDAEYMKWARGQGYRVNVWTVNDANEMRRLMRLGVDMIITGRPELLRQVLEAEREQGTANLVADVRTGSLSRECD